MANQIVAGELYETLTGQLFEIGRQLRQPNGYPFDPKQLKSHLQAAIEGRFSEPTGTFKRDMRKEGWKLLKNAALRINSVSNLEFVPVLKGRETSIKGEVLEGRALELGANYGQEDAEWLLENQEKIPKELRPFYIVFTETVWGDSVGGRNVACLFFCGGRWYLGFTWLDHVFISFAHFPRSRK